MLHHSTQLVAPQPISVSDLIHLLPRPHPRPRPRRFGLHLYPLPSHPLNQHG